MHFVFHGGKRGGSDDTTHLAQQHLFAGRKCFGSLDDAWTGWFFVGCLLEGFLWMHRSMNCIKEVDRKCVLFKFDIAKRWGAQEEPYSIPHTISLQTYVEQSTERLIGYGMLTRHSLGIPAALEAVLAGNDADRDLIQLHAARRSGVVLAAPLSVLIPLQHAPKGPVPLT